MCKCQLKLVGRSGNPPAVVLALTWRCAFVVFKDRPCWSWTPLRVYIKERRQKSCCWCLASFPDVQSIDDFKCDFSVCLLSVRSTHGNLRFNPQTSAESPYLDFCLSFLQCRDNKKRNSPFFLRKHFRKQGSRLSMTKTSRPLRLFPSQ
jgi:hypothetical protein